MEKEKKNKEEQKKKQEADKKKADDKRREEPKKKMEVDNRKVEGRKQEQTSKKRSAAISDDSDIESNSFCYAIYLNAFKCVCFVDLNELKYCSLIFMLALYILQLLKMKMRNQRRVSDSIVYKMLFTHAHILFLQ